MPGKKVFICAAPQDHGYYQELTAALDAWQAPHSELGVIPGPATALPMPVERAIQDCEVFVRICTANTRASWAVSFATAAFQKVLARERKRRSLVNLILDPSYIPDAQEQKTLYITTQGKARALWLEELATPIGVATIVQRVSRRAALGMGVGGAVAVASAGAASVLLYQRAQAPTLVAPTKISGHPAKTFKLSDQPAGGLTNNYAQVLLGGGALYAQPNLSDADVPDSSVYALAVAHGTSRRIPISTPDQSPQGLLVAASQSALMLNFSQDLFNPDGGLNTPNPSSLWAVSSQTGKRLWSVANDYAGVPTIADGVVYCGMGFESSRVTGTINSAYYLDAYRASDGRRLWRNGDVALNDVVLTNSITAPLAANGRVYMGGVDHNVYCVDAATGKTRWTYLTRGPALGTPATDGAAIYIGSNDGALYALEAATGKLRWRFATDNFITATPLIYSGVVYIVSTDSYLYALNAQTGALYWRAYVGQDANRDDRSAQTLTNSLAVYHNILFVGLSGALYAFDLRDGSMRWRDIPVSYEAAAGALYVSAPVVSDGLAIIGASDNQIYAVNP